MLCCYITRVMLCYITFVMLCMLYNMSWLCYITCVMLCYITYVMLYNVCHVMLCLKTCHFMLYNMHV